MEAFPNSFEQIRWAAKAFLKLCVRPSSVALAYASPCDRPKVIFFGGETTVESVRPFKSEAVRLF